MGHMNIISTAPTDLIEPFIERKRLKPEEKATLLNDLKIRVHPCHPLKANGLGTVTFRPFDKLQRKYFYDSSCLADTAFYAICSMAHFHET